MTGFRSFWCLTLALATLPLLGQEEKAAAPPHAIPYGTTFLIRLEDRLDVSRIQPGKRFKARLGEDLMGPDETTILRGSRIRGHVSEVGNGFHPRLLLSFDEIETRHGWAPLIATIIDVPGEHGLTAGAEGGIERRGQGRASRSGFRRHWRKGRSRRRRGASHFQRPQAAAAERHHDRSTAGSCPASSVALR